MISFLKKIKWSATNANSCESKNKHSSLLLVVFIGILEDVLFWKRIWLSLTFLLLFHIFFLMCLHKNLGLLQFLILLYGIVVSIDLFEIWLKHNHRVAFLKRLAYHDATRLRNAGTVANNWIKRKWSEFIYLRETNHTKAFLLINITLGLAFVIGNYISGYLLLYSLCMFVCLFHKLILPLQRFIKKIQQTAESDGELEGLIPDLSDDDMKVLSIEPEHNQVIDEKQSLDYWKPEDVPIQEVSDSSDESSSLVTNISMGKMETFDKDIETSDSSDDDYMPTVQQKEILQSTVEMLEPSNTWTSAAFNVFQNISGAMANMMYSTAQQKSRSRVSSSELSDGFEIIDKHDLK